METPESGEHSVQPRLPSRGQRGPADDEHERRRRQIIDIAEEHFRRYGYNKTTIADLAKAIGLSNAYIYTLFVSKQAIGEAACDLCLGRIQNQLKTIAEGTKPASERLRNVYQSLVKQHLEMFFNDRKLHDIVLISLEEGWESAVTHRAKVGLIIRQIVIEGRDSGEFERKTPLDETCRAIMQTLLSFTHPLLLEKDLSEIEENAIAVANLVLRSLAA